jgi:hypothetical protein
MKKTDKILERDKKGRLYCFRLYFGARIIFWRGSRFVARLVCDGIFVVVLCWLE